MNEPPCKAIRPKGHRGNFSMSDMTLYCLTRSFAFLLKMYTKWTLVSTATQYDVLMTYSNSYS